MSKEGAAGLLRGGTTVCRAIERYVRTCPIQDQPTDDGMPECPSMGRGSLHSVSLCCF